MINFMKLRWLYFGISLAVIIPGIFSLARYGLAYSIDFTGGSLLELRAQSGQVPTLETVKSQVGTDFQVGSVQSSGNGNFIIKGYLETSGIRIAFEVIHFNSIGTGVGINNNLG